MPGRRVQWLNTRFKVNTTITVEVMLDRKMTWKSLGKCSSWAIGRYGPAIWASFLYRENLFPNNR